ncbi:MAG: hypothetical protein HQ582_34480 [Planctomycetes bacterium]|nr:hypothetical protein [Planctomycetota bacterium]
MTLTFTFQGIQLSAADFPRDLAGWVAFSIAYAGTTGCRDKEAAIELLMYEAEKIIEQVAAGKPPEEG